MRISDQLKAGGRPTLSFEFFPPKDDVGFWDLYKTIEALKPIAPTYVSVTYGAGGATRRKTIDLVERIKNDLGIEPMAHLTCVGADRSEIAHVLDELKSHHIENVLALRGDPPLGQKSFVATEGGFRYASELVAFIRERRDNFCIAAACYPEGHPEAPSREADLENLKRKVDAGVDFLITQLFFDNADFLSFRERAERAGIRVPIVAGIMPILSVKQIKKFTEMCGAKIPKALLQKVEAVETDAEAVRHLGMYHATQQCLDLLREGVSGIHFYTLNRSTATSAICQMIKASM
ncbi:MAG: methylenetetrahydrofolate reductase [NAD(P)H] [Planctomycetes bacterium]|nr:methylenetetrahydrofolate reductase [NAD(P)H] [Planctomycetota bacterium]MBI3833719.1 methylenetetrahydrofolate reductase [NAD(P)H] [Planctomycetota bacterium]